MWWGAWFRSWRVGVPSTVFLPRLPAAVVRPNCWGYCWGSSKLVRKVRFQQRLQNRMSASKADRPALQQASQSATAHLDNVLKLG